MTTRDSLKKPEWLRVRLGGGHVFQAMSHAIHGAGLHTVCEAALCPNKGECWEKGHATLMILGETCTRACGFCNVGGRKPGAPDPEEPRRAAAVVEKAGLKEVVLTSVTRDDLPDGGAAIWAETIRRVRSCGGVKTIEALIPDFKGASGPLALVFEARPDILGHNLETVPSLYAAARPQADYRRSLDVLSAAKAAGLAVKSALMLGLGETEEEVLAVMKDAETAGCDIFYIGQYLRPSAGHLPVRRYATPDEFETYKRAGLEMGFKVVVSAPLARSSYRSEEQAAYLAR